MRDSVSDASTDVGSAGGYHCYTEDWVAYPNKGAIGAIGVSGDGVDQDDMVAYLGVAEAGQQLDTGLGHAPAALRADMISVPGGKLRYVQCPQAPFLNSSEQAVCPAL